MLYLSDAENPPVEGIKTVEVWVNQETKLEAQSVKQEKSLPLKFADINGHPRIFTLAFEQATDLSNAATMYAVYLPKITGTSKIWVNGNQVSLDTATDNPTSFFRAPVYAILPTAILYSDKPNQFRIDIRTAYAGYGQIGNIYVNETSQLDQYQRQRYFSSVLGMRLIAAVIFFLALMAIATYCLVQRDTFYLWFAVCSVFWIIYSQIFLLPVFPGSERVRSLIFVLGNFGYMAALPIFARRYMGIPFTVREMYYGGFVAFEFVALSTAILALPLTIRLANHTEVYLGLRALGVAVYILPTFWRYVKTTNQASSLFTWWLISILVVMMSFPLMTLMKVITGTRIGNVDYFMVGAVSLALIFISIYLRRLQGFFDGLMTLNRELDSKVAAAKQEITSKYQQLKELWKRDAVSMERDRIMRDIHDGVAGQLVTALAIMQRQADTNPKVVDILRESLTDLRLVVDSMVTADQSIDELLNNFRSRFSSVLSALNIDLVWQSSLSKGITLRQGETIDLYRCLQETCTNVIKHSSASQVSVQSQQSDNSIEIKVSDNGRPISDADHTGLGLDNIRRRASKLGGTAHFSRTQKNGFEVTLIIPVNAQ